MAKLTVKNVGPIREAELEVKKHTVFIGPQGSGKSTLAKLITICGGHDVLPSFFSNPDSVLSKYSLDNYLNKSTVVSYTTDTYIANFRDHFIMELTETSQNILNDKLKIFESQAGFTHVPFSFQYYKDFVIEQRNRVKMGDGIGNAVSVNLNFYNDFFSKYVVKDESFYLPAERTLTAILSNAIWSLMYSDINLPRMVTQFGRYFENVRNANNQFDIPFLQVRYIRKDGQDFIEYKPKQFVKLSESASGYQSIVPLLMVVENQRRQSQCCFVIEEPELNLYPTAQKGLIYNLMSGLDPAAEYKDAEWVITTHSPYILTSFNTLMLAYKVAQKSDELRAEVEKIIPSRCWINPDEFAAYYVDNGTVRSIISEKTGMISDNELDDVSEDFAGEQDQLLNLYRSIPSA